MRIGFQFQLMQDVGPSMRGADTPLRPNELLGQAIDA
jgi:hypothetical protein